MSANMSANPFHKSNLPSAQLSRIRNELLLNTSDEALGLTEGVIDRIYAELIPLMEKFEQVAIDEKVEADTNGFMLDRVRGIVESGYAHMGFTDMDHHQLAGMVRMLDREHIDHEAIVVAARDRIVYLADQVADLTDVVNELYSNGVKVLKDTTYEERSYKDTDPSQRYQNTCGFCGRTFEGPKHAAICAHCSNHDRDMYNTAHGISTLASLEYMLGTGKPDLARQYVVSKGLVAKYRAMLLDEEYKKTTRDMIQGVRESSQQFIAVAGFRSKNAQTKIDAQDTWPMMSYDVETSKSPRVGLSPAQKLLERKRAERAAKLK